MKRLAAAAALAALAAVTLAVLHGGGAYRVALIFDSAKGITPGQQVKIAGSVVGSVEDVHLVPGPRARITVSIDRRFAPFRTDAHCSILPQGLISENFIECDPGSAGSPLPKAADGIPTLGVQNTSVPLNLQDLLNVFSAPTDERLQILLDELGIATAGRGEDINAILRRADPALVQARRLYSILAAGRDRLARAVEQTNRVIAALAANRASVRAFVDRAAVVGRTTSARSAALAAAVRRLPATLSAVRPGLRSLHVTAESATPLVRYLGAAAPRLRSTARSLSRFSRLGRPALRALARAAARGRPTLEAAQPVALHLRRAVAQVSPLARSLDRFLVSLRDQGGVEGVLRVAYAFATNTSLYDSVSHIITFHVSAAPLCIAGQQAEMEVPGCNLKYSGPGNGELPVNEPGCGPKDESWWNETCPPVPGGAALPLPKLPERAQKALPAIQRQDDRAFAGRKPDLGKLRMLLRTVLEP